MPRRTPTGDNHHGIDVRARQQFAVIIDSGAAAVCAAGAGGGVVFVRLLNSLVAADAVHVADRHELSVGASQQHMEMAVPHDPAADEADVDARTGRRRAVRAED